MSADSTVVLDMIFNTTFEVIEKLKAVSFLHPSKHLDTAIEDLMTYRDVVSDSLDELKLANVIYNTRKIAGDLTVVTTVNPNGSTLVYINGKYSFLHERYTDTITLVNFIKYILANNQAIVDTDLTLAPDTLTPYSELVEFHRRIDHVNNNPQVNRDIISLEDYNKTTTLEVETPDKPIVVPRDVVISTVSKYRMVENDKIEPITVQEIENRKKANVEELRITKERIDNENNITKVERLKHRIGEIADGIGGTRSDVEAIRTATERWLADMTNDDTVDIFELVDIIQVQSKVRDPMLIRLLIQVCTINAKYQLQQFARIQPSTKSLYMNLNMSDKELLVGVALSNFNHISEQRYARTYGDYNLTIYIIDMCSKGNSLTITENPAEVALLAEGMYSILLSHNLDADSVYAADVNNQFDAYSANWFKTNDVINSYLTRVVDITEGCDQGELVELMCTLFNERDVTMTTPRLDTDDVNQLMDWSKQLPVYPTNNISNNLAAHGDTVIISGLYPADYDNGVAILRHALIMATNDAIAIFVETKGGGLTQEFYVPERANKIALWLKYYLPLNNGEF